MNTLTRLRSAIREDLLLLEQLLSSLDSTHYQQKIDLLSGSSIGQHIRHILEFYSCALSSVCNDSLCYDDRKRDYQIESGPDFACNVCHDLINIMYLFSNTDIDAEMQLRANFSSNLEDGILLKTNLMRELAYCLEHSVHHQALIKIGLIELNLAHTVNKNFGVAPATQRFSNQNQVQAER